VEFNFRLAFSCVVAFWYSALSCTHAVFSMNFSVSVTRKTKGDAKVWRICLLWKLCDVLLPKFVTYAMMGCHGKSVTRQTFIPSNASFKYIPFDITKLRNNNVVLFDLFFFVYFNIMYQLMGRCSTEYLPGRLRVCPRFRCRNT
jgi:hypothetical protein